MIGLINDTGMLVVVVAVVLLFGASRLPKLARNLGEAGREFRKAHDEANPSTDVAPATPGPVSIDSPRPAASDDRVTVNRRELDALLAAKGAGEPTSNPSRPSA